MKKIVLLSLLSLLIVNKTFSWEITGQTNVCASPGGNLSYEYKFTGFPAGSTNHYFSVSTTGGVVARLADDKFSVAWSSDCSVANTKIQTNAVTSWLEEKGDGTFEYKFYSGAVELAVNVARLGTLTPNAWNATPFACNTSPITYSIQAVCGASFYSWSIPPGWSPDPSTPLSGPNATFVILYPTATGGGPLSVNVVNTNNGCNLTKSYNVTITRPVQPPVFTTTQTGYCAVANAQINVASVPNASSYSWTYPAGWTGPSTTTTPYTTVSFNGQVKSGNICCQTNASCGGTSNAVCLPVSYDGALPTDDGIYYNVAITGAISISKKTITITVSSCYWAVAKGYIDSNGMGHNLYYNTNETQTSPSSFTYSMPINSGERILVSVHNRNSCGRSTGTGVGYQLVNGNLEYIEVGRVITKDEETASSDQNEDFKIFPNPASAVLTVETTNPFESKYNVSVYDMIGKKVMETVRMSTAKEEINVSNLENGIYFLQIEEGNAVIRKEKIVINH